MIVVADTSPLNYLLQLNQIELLYRIYGRILLPEEVRVELMDPDAPVIVAAWASAVPPWIEVRQPTITVDGVEHLDAGERSALTLAVEVHASLILADEQKARYTAETKFGIPVTGTLGVLLSGHASSYADGFTLFEQLCGETNFYCSLALRQDFVALLKKATQKR